MHQLAKLTFRLCLLSQIWTLPKLTLIFSTSLIPSLENVLIDSGDAPALSLPSDPPRKTQELDIEQILIAPLGESSPKPYLLVGNLECFSFVLYRYLPRSSSDRAFSLSTRLSRHQHLARRHPPHVPRHWLSSLSRWCLARLIFNRAKTSRNRFLPNRSVSRGNLFHSLPLLRRGGASPARSSRAIVHVGFWPPIKEG